ncbi:selenium metabolism-associated LysR family transcriptional regulator [Virgibacillus alimentarius]|uniref:selenium metabolism-associated LysR family transcriptional regulator n=1 Tax=Virgibacillus alimentarius TaxID=698769 RepID=UPI00049357F2|nr:MULTISPECIES: selenium metabolism-associated LysR family transcriptional regulator [Virgibacillus]HLR65629.1 selenium metabolism-associated LysR family transcriptional regulator [Virgibacillus sp.]
MNYERLKTFIAVAERKSFSEAAKILFVTQPTITAQVKALEEELDTKLFERTTKKVEMTQSASILLKYAKEIVHLNDVAKKEVLKIEEFMYGDLSIGCSLTIGEYILPEFLKRLKEMYPLINMSVDITNSNNIVEHMKDQLIDVGLVETPIEDPKMIFEPFWEDELLLIAAPDYFSQDEIRISHDLLKSTPLIMREKGSGTRSVLMNHLKDAGISINDLNIVMELGSTEAIKSAVEAGLGVSIISKHAIKKEQKLQLLKAYTIKNVTFNRYFYIAVRKDQVLKSTADVFVEELKKLKREKMKNTLIHLPASNC